MDADDFLPSRGGGDMMALLAKQDLDPLSLTELEDRITLLSAEIERTKQKIFKAVNHKASADALFRKP